MRLANLLAMALGLIIAAIGVLGIASPAILVEFGRSLRSSGALWIVAAVRVAAGIVLLWAAPDARTPLLLRILGVLILLAGLATPFLGHDWGATPGSFLTRVWPGVAIALGLFIAYSALPKPSGM